MGTIFYKPFFVSFKTYLAKSGHHASLIYTRMGELEYFVILAPKLFKICKQ